MEGQLAKIAREIPETAALSFLRRFFLLRSRRLRPAVARSTVSAAIKRRDDGNSLPPFVANMLHGLCLMLAIQSKCFSAPLKCSDVGKVQRGHKSVFKR